MTPKISIELLFEPSADSIHHTVIVADRHSAVVVPDKVFLALCLFGCWDCKQFIDGHLEFTHRIFICVFYVCVVLLHQSGVDEPHEVRLFIRNKFQIKPAGIRIFNQVYTVAVMPLPRHWLSNNPLGFVNGILLEKLAAFDSIVEFFILAATFGVLCLNIKHRSNPVRGLADIVAKAVDVRLNKVFLTYNLFARLTLNTH